MMFSRIAPYAAYSSYSRNQSNTAFKTNQSDSVAFKCNFSKTLGPKMLSLVEEILGEMYCGSLTAKNVLTGEDCVARISDLAGQINLYLDLGKTKRYVIGLIDESNVNPSTHIRLETLGKSDFSGTETPLDTKSEYDEAVKTVETLLNALKPKEEEAIAKAS